MTPRIRIGLVLYNQVRHLRPALESLLAQTYRDFRLVVMDDSTLDQPGRIVREYAAGDSRIRYVRNRVRKGYLENSRRAFLHPDADFEYFAWAGDHDWWHPDWLRRMVEALDTHPDAVLAYPLVVRITDDGKVFSDAPMLFDTTGLELEARIRMVGTRLAGCGDMIYGLFRANALRHAAVMRNVLLPDRLLLAELAMLGSFKQVLEPLWLRRYGDTSALSRLDTTRQRKNLFGPISPPLHTYLPWWITHAGSLVWSLALRSPASAERRWLGLTLAWLTLRTWFRRTLDGQPGTQDLGRLALTLRRHCNFAADLPRRLLRRTHRLILCRHRSTPDVPATGPPIANPDEIRQAG